MQLIELKTFLAIVEAGSLVKASRELNVTQSTVTARLKSLEDEFGQRLINRQKSGATLTASGERLRRYANTISDLWKQATQEISLPDEMSTVCNLACQPDLWQGLGLTFFEHIQTELPKVAISVWQGSEADITSWLDNGLSDIAFSYSPKANQNQIVKPIAMDELILVSTQENSSIRFDPNYVLIEAGEDFSKQYAASFSDADTARINFGMATQALEFILNNGGSSYMPKRMALRHLQEGKLFYLKQAPSFTRQIFLTANKQAIKKWLWLEAALSLIK